MDIKKIIKTEAGWRPIDRGDYPEVQYHDLLNDTFPIGEIVEAHLQDLYLDPAFNIWSEDISPLYDKQDLQTKQIWVLADKQEGKGEQPTKDQPESEVYAAYINKLNANLNTLQSPSAPKVEANAETILSTYPEAAPNRYWTQTIIDAMEQYATLKTSALQSQLQDKEKEIESLNGEIMHLNQKINKKPTML